MPRLAFRLASTLSCFVLSACYGYRPPAPPIPTTAQPVNASFGKTWDAVIDLFSEQNISIATIERASGLIVAAPTYTGTSLSSGLEYADCGTMSQIPILPNRVQYNVRVKGDSTTSTLRVNVVFLSVWEKSTYECNTKNVWEKNVWARIAARAEGR